MNDMNRFTRARLCLLVASLAFNAFLLLIAGWLLVNFIGIKYSSHGYAKAIVASRPVGLALVSLVEGALQGRGRRDILEKIDSICSAHPDILLGYKRRFQCKGSDKAQGKDCIEYEGEYLVFRGEKFTSFDADFKCTPQRYNYVFRGRNRSQAK